MPAAGGSCTRGHLHGERSAGRNGVVYDDERVIASAGVMLAGRLGIEAMVDETVDLADRAGATNPSRK